MEGLCSDYLKRNDRPRVFSLAIQFLSWVRVVSEIAKSVTFEDVEGSEQNREEAMITQTSNV